MKSLLLRFIRYESGATAIEYGLIAAGISVAIIATVNTLGGQLQNLRVLPGSDVVSESKIGLCSAADDCLIAIQSDGQPNRLTLKDY